jgi:hypothetical protein
MLLGPMPFDFYENLSRAQKATYRRSDAVAHLDVVDVGAIRPELEAIERGLDEDDLKLVAQSVGGLVDELLRQWRVPPVRVEVLARRPSNETSELHGLYTREEGRTAQIQVWMRTAAHVRPVSFRTFLRTVVHEVMHHLDFELLALEDTFHTEGFFRRESSVMRQLVGRRQPKPGPASKPRDDSRQLALFPTRRGK